MEEDKVDKNNKKSKIIIFIKVFLLVLFIASIVSIIILGIKYKHEKQKREDIRELLSFYSSSNRTVNDINDYSESLYNAWYEYIMNKKYSSIDAMLKSVMDSEANKLDLIDSFGNMAKEEYGRIKKDNYYYKNNSDIKKQVDKTIDTLVEYHDFILANNELSYISLGLQKDIHYSLCNTILDSLLITVINNTK